MKKFLFLIALICATTTLSAQYVYTIKADSVKITNHCDTAELILENHTQNVLGFLYNKGRGRTEFRRPVKLNDSTIIIGLDTISLRGSDSKWMYDANNNLTHKPFAGDSVKIGNKVFYVNSNITQTGSLFSIGSARLSVASNSIIFSRNLPSSPSGGGNVGVGLNGLFQSLTTGGQNIAMGDFTMTAVTTGSGNAGIGAGALQRLTTGTRNIGAGYQTMQFITTSSDNVDIGGITSNAAVGSSNVFIGSSGVTGSSNVRTLGSHNTIVGRRPAGTDGNISTNDSNIVLGAYSFTNATTNTTIIGNAMSTTLSNVLLLGKPNQKILVGTGTNNGAKFQVSGTGTYSDTLTATTMGNADNSDRVASTAFVKNVMGSPALTIVNSGTSDFSITAGVLTKLEDLIGAGSHSVTLPSASTHSGQRILIWNMNNSGNSWTFATSVTLPDGTTSNTIANQTTIELISDGTVWLKWK